MTLDVDYVLNKWLARMGVDRDAIVDVSRALLNELVEAANSTPRPAGL